MALAEKLAEPGTQTALGSCAHHLQLRPQQIGLEARDELLRQLAQPSAAIGEFLPLVAGEEMEDARILRTRRAVAEVHRSDDGGPGIDVGRQEIRALGQRIDEGALARLDLADHGDAAEALLKLLARGEQQRPRMLTQRVAQPVDERQETQAYILERRANALVSQSLAPVCGKVDVPGPGRSGQIHAHASKSHKIMQPAKPRPSEVYLMLVWESDRPAAACHFNDIGQLGV